MSKSSELEVGSIEWKDWLYSIKNTKEWQPALMDLFEKDEMVDGHPSADGLARLFRLVFGEFNTGVEVVKSPNVEDRSATVVVTIECDSPHYGVIKHGGSADTAPNNTKHPYSLHPVSTAETKALGRALKRALGLRLHTHEEIMADDEKVTFEKIGDTQIRAIKNMCDKLGVDIEKLLVKECGVGVDMLGSDETTISTRDGMRMLDLLHKIRNSKKDTVPDDLALVKTTEKTS